MPGGRNGVVEVQALAPIALFAYNRPQHLRRTVEALAANPLAAESELFVFLDGPRNEDDRTLGGEIREYVSSIDAFQSVSLIEQDRNIGLAASIIGGVSRMFERHEVVIVVEDDILTSPFFLRYMNEALRAYRDDEAVASVHGFVYEIKGLPETFFLRGADCWGWATWRRAWRVFDSDGARLLQELKDRDLIDEFDLHRAMPYTQMLLDQIEGRNNSWAIRWHASAFLKGMMTLHPGRSLIRNIGLDGSGTHCQDVPAHLDVMAASSPVRVDRIPLMENQSAKAKIIEFLQNQATPQIEADSLISRVFRFLRFALTFK